MDAVNIDVVVVVCFVLLFLCEFKSGPCEDPKARGRGEVDYGGVEGMLGQNSSSQPHRPWSIS